MATGFRDNIAIGHGVAGAYLAIATVRKLVKKNILTQTEAQEIYLEAADGLKRYHGEDFWGPAMGIISVLVTGQWDAQ